MSCKPRLVCQHYCRSRGQFKIIHNNANKRKRKKKERKLCWMERDLAVISHFKCTTPKPPQFILYAVWGIKLYHSSTDIQAIWITYDRSVTHTNTGTHMCVMSNDLAVPEIAASRLWILACSRSGIIRAEGRDFINSSAFVGWTGTQRDTRPVSEERVDSTSVGEKRVGRELSLCPMLDPGLWRSSRQDTVTQVIV